MYVDTLFYRIIINHDALRAFKIELTFPPNHIHTYTHKNIHIYMHPYIAILLCILTGFLGRANVSRLFNLFEQIEKIIKPTTAARLPILLFLLEL